MRLAFQVQVRGGAVRPPGSRRGGRDDEAIAFSVVNPGRIAPDLLPELFEPFRSRSSGAGRSGGLGLGLYIARQIVVAHGGTLEASAGSDLVTLQAEMPRTSRAVAAADAMIGRAN